MSEVCVVPELPLPNAVQGTLEILAVNVFAANSDHVVVGDHLPTRGYRFQGVAKSGVDSAASEAAHAVHQAIHEALVEGSQRLPAIGLHGVGLGTGKDRIQLHEIPSAEAALLHQARQRRKQRRLETLFVEGLQLQLGLTKAGETAGGEKADAVVKWRPSTHSASRVEEIRCAGDEPKYETVLHLADPTVAAFTIRGRPVYDGSYRRPRGLGYP